MKKAIVALILVLLLTACVSCPNNTVSCCYEDAAGNKVCACYKGITCPSSQSIAH